MGYSALIFPKMTDVAVEFVQDLPPDLDGN